MFNLNNISLVQFKNYQKAFFDFNERIVGIHGNNGQGKTNLLDAIYYLCFTRSYFSKSDIQNVTHGFSGFRLEGTFEREDEQQKLVCILRETGKKELSLNDEHYDRFSSHIGKFPCVIITPDDSVIITGGSEERRRFLDALLSQLDKGYLQNLIDYNKIMQQRNRFLKSFADKQTSDLSLLDVYDQQLVSTGQPIFEKRSIFLKEFLPAAANSYRKISGTEESVELFYESQLHRESYSELMKRHRERDMILQRTGIGPHKDDLELRLEEQQFRQIASQGQRKSLLFALKLAEYEFLKSSKGWSPILLLDDVFEKLDALRMHNLLEWVCIQNEGQVFLTDTHKERIIHHMGQLSTHNQLIAL
ncbi:MAG: DNA replication and repair protein RecF [Bacteroidetes bacterium]|nr:MAG: DNA replication and repair protein RecF [Bacteroidota bacterium]